MTPEAFAAKAKTLAEDRGIQIAGHEGTIELMGVKAGYVYSNGTLKITILDKPFFLSEEMCEKQLRAWL